METAFWVKWQLPDRIWASNLVYGRSSMHRIHESKSFFILTSDIYSIFLSFPVKPSFFLFKLCHPFPPFIPLFFPPLRPVDSFHTASKVLKPQRWLSYEEKEVLDLTFLTSVWKSNQGYLIIGTDIQYCRLGTPLPAHTHTHVENTLK